MKILRFLPTLILKGMVQIVYVFCCLFFPINNKKVTFASYRSNSLQGNLLHLYNELKVQHPDFISKCLFRKPKSTKSGKISYIIHMFASIFHMATSKYFFIDDYYLPVYLIKPRRNTQIIQVWHAAGAFKKFGYSTIGKTFGPTQQYLKHVKVHSNYTHVIVSSSEVIPFFSEAFNTSPEKILPLGLPRTDFLLEQKNSHNIKNRLYNTYPELKGKKIMLYAPTFRGKSHYQSNFEGYLDFSALKSKLDEEYVLLVKYHPYISESLEIDSSLRTFVYQIDDSFNTEEILLISDVLVTDYSSIIFDFSLLGRPIAFMAKDLEKYKKERDFYYDYKSFVPGPIFENSTDLAWWVKEANFDIAMVEEFSNKFFDIQDGCASQRIIERLIQPEPQKKFSLSTLKSRQAHLNNRLLKEHNNK
jgi:CDP-glycerol glycerophosphotransferase (TagB/SpsB family)